MSSLVLIVAFCRFQVVEFFPTKRLAFLTRLIIFSAEEAGKMLFKILPLRALGAGPEFSNNMEAPANVAGNEDPKDYYFNSMGGS